MRRETQSKNPTHEFPVLQGQCLGHVAYRGFARLRDLTAISRADIFDQENNRLGTQRNLSAAHARKAYRYVAENSNAFYPEIILNLRDDSFIEFSPLQKVGEQSFGVLRFLKNPADFPDVVVSRLDGNHRLWFTDGHEKGMEAVLRPVSFCLLVLTKIEDELEIFRDINDNQMGMNTSHLQNITARLLGQKALKVQNPAVYIVQKLQKDKSSPLYKRIHEGGRVRKGATLGGLTTSNLTGVVRDMLTRSAKLALFPDADAQYEVIKNYWMAVKQWLPKAWRRPRDFIIFKGVGLYAISYLGIEVIDRCLLRQKYTSDDMFAYLKQISDVGVFSSGGAPAYAGRSGGRRMANDLIQDLEDESGVSLAKLQKLILGGG
jgi:DGQHR domain-containing protein